MSMDVMNYSLLRYFMGILSFICGFDKSSSLGCSIGKI